MSDIELLKKLQVKSGAKLWLINVPETIAEAITAGAEVEPVRPGDPFDGVLAFCHNAAEVATIAPRVLEGIAPDGLMWFAHRKGAPKSAGLTRDVGWEPLVDAGWRIVRTISFDKEWSGVRFRPAAKVKTSR